LPRAHHVRRATAANHHPWRNSLDHRFPATIRPAESAATITSQKIITR
jgi:hypothetical protein